MFTQMYRKTRNFFMFEVLETTSFNEGIINKDNTGDAAAIESPSLLLIVARSLGTPLIFKRQKTAFFSFIQFYK